MFCFTNLLTVRCSLLSRSVSFKKFVAHCFHLGLCCLFLFYDGIIVSRHLYTSLYSSFGYLCFTNHDNYVCNSFSQDFGLCVLSFYHFLSFCCVRLQQVYYVTIYNPSNTLGSSTCLCGDVFQWI